jgi:hypothetical protein
VAQFGVFSLAPCGRVAGLQAQRLHIGGKAARFGRQSVVAFDLPVRFGKAPLRGIARGHGARQARAFGGRRGGGVPLAGLFDGLQHLRAVEHGQGLDGQLRGREEAKAVVLTRLQYALRLAQQGQGLRRTLHLQQCTGGGQVGGRHAGFVANGQ